jgi:predicted DNA-binding transcriptional regulator YafY
VRTIHRDAEALREAGIPVRGERGPAGGYRLPGGHRTRLTGLSATEAEALFVAAPPDDLGLGAVVADAQLKLLASLPPELRLRARRAEALFHVDRDRWFAPAAPQPHLPVIAAALWHGNRLRLRHRGRDRIVDPLGLVAKGQAWYLVTGTPSGLRTFGVARVQDAEELDEAAERPEGFDLATAWASWSKAFEASLPLRTVRVRVAPGALGALRRAADSRARDALPTEESAGWRELDVAFETLEIAAIELRGMGPRVEVLAPAELRSGMAADARAAAALYTAT